MGLFQKFKEGLQNNPQQARHEIKRIVTASPRLTSAGIEELEAALIGADLGQARHRADSRRSQERLRNPGRAGLDVFAIARAEVEKSPRRSRRPAGAPTPRLDRRLHRRRPTAPARPPPPPSSPRPRAGRRPRRRPRRLRTPFAPPPSAQLKLWGERLGDTRHRPAPPIPDRAAIAHDRHFRRPGPRRGLFI